MKTQLPFFKPDNIVLRDVSDTPVVIITAESTIYVTKIMICNTSNSLIYIYLKKIKHADVVVPIEIFKANRIGLKSNMTFNLLKEIGEDSIQLEDLDSLIIYTNGRSFKCDVDVDFLISLENL